MSAASTGRGSGSTARRGDEEPDDFLPKRAGGAGEPIGPDTPLDALMTASTVRVLERDFGMRRVDDLLHFYPRRYTTRGQLTAIAETPIGEHVTIVAEVRRVDRRSMRQRRGTLVEVVIFDGRANATLTFFNQPWRAQQLAPGQRGIFSGKATLYRGGIQLAHPDYRIFDDEHETVPTTHEAEAWAAEILPIYPATTRMTSWRSATLIERALGLIGEIPDPVPAQVRAELGSMSLDEAVRTMHQPSSMSRLEPARRALRLTEAFVLQTALLQDRAASRAVPAAPRAGDGGLLARFDATLPFALTSDQTAVGDEIARELAATAPMQRLVQGEVGSGKTVVAVRAMLQVAENGGQSAMLAPTEVLATQHLRSITSQLGPDLAAELQPTLLTGGMSTAQRRRALLRIASGDARIVVGTHALLSDTVSFFDLGLVVVDEQHRFGVEQRERLREASSTPPHLLVLTATPIPRTVAMTVFGDLDVSTIAELPGGRAGIETHVVPADRPTWVDRAWARLGEEVASGRQGFIVCPAIDPTDAEAADPDDGWADAPGSGDEAGITRPTAQARKAEAEYREAVRRNEARQRLLQWDEDEDDDGDDEWHGRAPLPRRPLPDEIVADPPEHLGGPPPEPEQRAPRTPTLLPVSVTEVALLARSRPELAGRVIGVLHGRLSSDEKDDVMRRFADGEIDVLVATTVIEVGVNVPNASVMMVMGADRFGVSQLHQLRGRVGRGEHAGLCLLVTAAQEESTARERVEAVAATNDGFELAQRDLELRREGDVLGTAQSGGASSLRLLRVARDGDLIDAARSAAGVLLDDDPRLLRGEHAALRAALHRIRDEQRDFLGKS